MPKRRRTQPFQHSETGMGLVQRGLADPGGSEARARTWLVPTAYAGPARARAAVGIVGKVNSTSAQRLEEFWTIEHALPPLPRATFSS